MTPTPSCRARKDLISQATTERFWFDPEVAAAAREAGREPEAGA